MAWQKRARLGVAIFGIVCAAVVYAALGERHVASPPDIVERLDPKAIAESKDGRLRQLRESDEDFNVTFERQLTYENGRSKSFGVRIAAKERGGSRDFQVKADEAEAGDNQQVLRLAGHVRLDASDGFMLATDRATFSQADGIVHSDGKVAFGKARMSGYGTNTTYNQKSDVLAIATAAHIEMRNERDVLTLNFDAGAATLDRMQDVLTLDGMVHVVRERQVIEADHAVAHLDSEDQFITLLELRGNARVQGTGGGLDAMSARDIDLHYTPDGKALERVILTGGSAIALTGDKGAPGRSVTGDSVDTQLAPDGSVTHLTATATAAKAVRLELPAGEGTPARSITARTLDATGTPGQGLTNARFVDAVEFREDGQKDNPARTVRAHTLDAALTTSSVGEAVFSGAVRFDEQGLNASAAELRYMPDAGTLKLSGSDSGGGPHVADERITIDAQGIDVTLQGRRMSAAPAVKTTLLPAGTTKTSGTTTSSSTGSEPNRLPGLLKQDKPASVNAAALDYDGAGGKATYTGTVTLWQGDTSLRADTVTLDERKGDLVATGSAVLRLLLENGESVGQAHEIKYDDERHLVTYFSLPSASRGTVTPPRATPAGRSGASPRPSQPHLNGPQGDLRADRLELFLAESGSALDRLEAYDAVTMAVDAGTPTRRTATGARLTYRAAREEYEMSGTATAPVDVVESCRRTTGKTLIFYKSADRIIVDGKNEIRTETKSSGSCSQSAPPAPTRP